MKRELLWYDNFEDFLLKKASRQPVLSAGIPAAPS